MRVSPKPSTALIVFMLYLVLFYGVWVVTDVDYENIGESADTLMKWYFAPTWVGGIAMAIAVWWLGWWRPVMFERERSGARWLMIAPAFTAILLILFAITSDFSGLNGAMVLFLLLGSAGVGFAEEITTRGILITGFRPTMTEPAVWFFSCLLFGLLHLPNWFFGLGAASVPQVLLAFGVGSTFYLLRRFSGTLVLCMVLHAAWDFVAFAGERPGSLAALVVVNALVGLVFGLVYVRSARGQRVGQSDESEVAA
ncbi:CPBP family intramembrane glutamic endopeptidase [Nocardioides sp. GY 10113]|uniref:CPBP family intramembrane glutamic endopeptidase n=1 Tax=Nocardioides sp. GY 10113 TaxID=2569761 RepID=UPI0014590C9C|nr:CPBP family intramembrane glutamic endopeptidase [Nocardioides sp. GY 10113]